MPTIHEKCALSKARTVSRRNNHHTLIHRGEQWTKPKKSAKTLPPNIERRVSPDAGVTAYRLAA
jgi:hypothetical protein